MGGGDLNLKKGWHPLLFKNQERVWKEEKKAIDERKRTQQLLKEQAEERQIQELQRLGGKREERVDWLYNAPATGSGQNTEEMEAYLLGKKSVEQLFNEQDKKRMESLKQQAAAPGASGTSASINGFQALGNNANSVRDLAAKIRDDPLLAIKKQEQRAYEELLKNPQRVRELREARDASLGKSSKKKMHRHHRDEDGPSRSRDRADDRRSRRARDEGSFENRPRHRDWSQPEPPRRHAEERGQRRNNRSISPAPRSERSGSRERLHRRSRSRSPLRRAYESRTAIPPKSTAIPNAAARLAAMTASAADIHKARDARLTESAEADRLAEEREAADRESKKVKGGGRLDPSFLKQQQDRFMAAKLEARS